ncbi:MAG: phosphocholine cytidylyltransferase family protein [Oscillospiraceae bacterium]|nr:phosphocholine cytidylyltransferase family protein [Oscillospiraceae bacterium]
MIEPQTHFVRRAIIMAAGIGQRMRPVTLTTPKPLVPVNGVRMIDTVIRALRENGITEIYVVVGYRKEQFQPLEVEYAGLKLIENPYYDTCNNISSLYVAREHLGDSIILDGDQIIYNPAILAPEFALSGYNAVWTDRETGEWLMQVEDGVVRSCSRTGGAHGWQLYSISRWTAEDGARLRRHLEIEFEEKGNRQIYWDDVAMFCYPQEYRLGIREMQRTDIIEIDDLAELAGIDPSYSVYQEGQKG